MDPAKTPHIGPGPLKACHMGPGPFEAFHIGPGPLKACHIGPGPFKACHIGPGPLRCLSHRPWTCGVTLHKCDLALMDGVGAGQRRNTQTRCSTSTRMLPSVCNIDIHSYAP